MVVLRGDGFLIGGVALRLAVAGPKLIGRGKLIERDFPRDSAATRRPVMLQEGVAVGTVGEWHIENLGVSESLLHAVADRVVVVLRFQNGERNVWFVGEDVVRLLRLPTLNCLATHDDATFREVGFLTNLGHQVPLTRADNGGRDELAADVCLGEGFFVHAALLHS